MLEEKLRDNLNYCISCWGGNERLWHHHINLLVVGRSAGFILWVTVVTVYSMYFIDFYYMLSPLLHFVFRVSLRLHYVTFLSSANKAIKKYWKKTILSVWHPTIQPSIILTSFPVKGHRSAGADPSCHWTRAQDASLSHSWHIETDNRSHLWPIYPNYLFLWEESHTDTGSTWNLLTEQVLIQTRSF